MTNPRNSPGRDSDTWDLRARLDELAKTKSGVSFIYSALGILAARYHLNDAVVILEDQNFNTQMFRLGGKAVTAGVGSRFDSVSGVYCDPPIVSDDQREMVHLACQQSFSRNLEQFNAARDIVSIAAESPDANQEIFVADEVGPASRGRTMLSGVARLRHLSENLTLQELPRPRTIVSALLLISDVLIFALTLGDVHGPLRFLLGLVLGLAIPGWSIVGLLRLENAPLEVGLSISVSLSLLIVVAQLLITFHLWHPIALEELTCLACFPSLFWQSRDLRQLIVT